MGVENREFIIETNHVRRSRLTALSLVVAVALIAGLIIWLLPSSMFPSTSEILSTEKLNPVSIGVSAFFSGLFFVPVPLEALYVLGLRSGSAPWLTYITTLGGLFLGLLISYLIGWRLSGVVMHLVNAKKLYGLRRKVNRWGSLVVLIANIIPAPSPQLTFALALARYPFARLFLIALAAKATEFAVITWFIIATS